jgi:hypothetical protein
VTAGADAATPTRYRLDVIASRPDDVVRHAGGWMFDHVMAGWDVTALLPECSDPAPLHILGVRVAALDGEPLPGGAQAANTIAVCAGFYSDDAGIRRYLGDAMSHGSEVVLWPGDPCVRVVPAVGQMHHRLTRAACVFKAEALRALNIARNVDSVEWFRCLTCNAATVPGELAVPSRRLPRRAFNCSASNPVPAECDDSTGKSEGTVTHPAERRDLQRPDAKRDQHPQPGGKRPVMNRYAVALTRTRDALADDWRPIP